MSDRTQIAMIDYGMGNVHSVSKALEAAGAAVTWLSEPAGLDRFAGVVLPGVGSFGDGVRELGARGLSGPVCDWIRRGRPFLGICVGMQLLLDGSDEAPGVRGFGICRGTVKRFTPSDPALKVPQMGWNEVDAREQCPLFAGIPPRSHFYFVHSYYAEPAGRDVVGGETEYGVKYCSFLWQGRMFASQFHPEKSQTAGLRMLRNFVDLAGA
ncbi:imidazole glycerol phosphate synthase subunit HisH [bacterium]|nr:imidazole glycerol phosphate synthase subunit HisH [bacterium]